ncbi:MAG: HDOD domain-containing protein [Oceanicoccus sp.]|uniref:HDOD domain-containing protein n=1 Tax=Oceanicoccus sp. TaxID=2691044 RepID=UPI0026386098|nr:HDOD domain-containing protein [Oceanicoccus sp.]MDG1772891.1 HDOD domain-containing protein [Oceanicoccus sp.]
MVTKTAIDQLPSLPQVLVQILDAVQKDNADYQRIADIIRHDAGIATNLVAVANSSYYGAKNCESIERALLFLGTDVVKTIVITACIKQFFGHFNQQHQQFLKRFWRRSLITANFAQVLATLTSYAAPDEAYLCGLLADVGQLVTLTSNEQQYLAMLATVNNDQQLLAAEQQQFDATHCEIGADLIDNWGISGFMADAVRYHHEADQLILDAHHLVKIVNLASQLSTADEIDDQALATADNLFGLNESLTRELFNRVNSDVDAIANSLGIDIADTEVTGQRYQQAHQQLGERLGELGELAQLNAALWQARSQDGLQEAAQRSLFLTLGISGSVLFLLDDESQKLCSQTSGQQPQAPNQALNFEIPLEAGRSLISDAFLNNSQQSSTQTSTLTVIDRQMLRYCQSDILVCWPLTQSTPEDNKAVGVLVFACTQQKLSELEQRSNLARQICQEIAGAIADNQHRFELIEQEGPTSSQYQQHIREAVHEASNPLSIIRNYLEMLKIKLGDEHDANEGLELIKEEMDRVGNILLRLKDPGEIAESDTSVNINQIIETTAHIFEDSICVTKNISLEKHLDSSLGDTTGNPEHLKQILTNLLKNAVEALQPGGKITLSSEASVSFSGRDFAAINIEDNGPGIAPEVKKNLFSPVDSTKGQGHSGLGLSIVKKLIDDMDGSIVCRSNPDSGTQFQILLPN